MKVKELIALLQKEDPEREVILQKDAGGNGHSPLSDLWTATYVPDSTWSGEVYPDSETDEDNKKALILTPVN